LKDEVLISQLIGEGGFPDERSFLSFCLSAGVFYGRRSQKEENLGIPLDELTSYHICSLVVLFENGGEMETDRMRDLLREYLNGGIQLVREKTAGKHGMEPLFEVANIMPP
jgi:hypothetical protein